MDTYYKGNYHQHNHQRQDYNRPPQLNPINPIPKLQKNEIGIRSDLKGPEIKNVVDKVVRMLVYRHFDTVTLKSRGNGVSKLISIVDILKNKVLGLYHYTKTYSTSYQNDNKEIKLPCMDAILSLEEPKDKTYGFVPPKKLEDMDEKYIDPKDFDNNNRRHFQPGFRGRGRGRGRGTRGNFRGNYRGNNNNQRGNFRGRGVPMRGRGGYQQDREYQNRGYQNYHNYRQQEDEDYPNFRNNDENEEHEQRGYNNNRIVYRGRGGYERNNNNYENRYENRYERGNGRGRDDRGNERGRGGYERGGRGNERGRGHDRGNRGRAVNRGRGGRD